MELEKIAESLLKGDSKTVRDLVQSAIEKGLPIDKILNEGLIAGMSIVGEKFKNNEIYIPEVLLAARAMKAGMELLRPHLVKSGIKPIAKFAIGTVKGDFHDIGKNLVAMMMEGAGFEVIDLGIDCGPEKFIAAIKEHNVQIIGMSALLTTTMLQMKNILQALEKESLRTKVKAMVGGAPVTQSYCDEIGADGYAPDAASAVEKAKQLLGVL